MTIAPIRLLLIDDHVAFRMPLAILLEQEPDLTVIGQAGSLEEARPMVRRLADRSTLPSLISCSRMVTALNWCASWAWSIRTHKASF